MSNKSKIVFESSDEDTGIVENEDGSRTVFIKEFDLNKMHPLDANDLESGVKIVVIGKPKTGKSTIIEQIMLYKAHICPVSQIFSGTEDTNHFYAPRSTDITVFEKLDTKAVENFIKRQKIARQYLTNPWAMQILDDCTDDPSIIKTPLFQAIYKRGRHFNMINVNGVQYPMDLGVSIRSCVDYCFLMSNSILSERKKLYENFASGCIPSFRDFCDIMDQVCENHTALVINNMCESNKLEDRLFYFRADKTRIPPNFKLGSHDSFEFDTQRRDPNYVSSVI